MVESYPQPYCNRGKRAYSGHDNKEKACARFHSVSDIADRNNLSISFKNFLLYFYLFFKKKMLSLENFAD